MAADKSAPPMLVPTVRVTRGDGVEARAFPDRVIAKGARPHSGEIRAEFQLLRL
jgi:hypothetical protein